MKRLLLLTAIAPTVAMAAYIEKPNIIVILSDDMGYSDIGCYGSEIKTPNLDRLAKSGVRFTQFYNGARSCPSRASLMTGLYPHQAGLGGMTVKPQKVTEGYTGSINKKCVTIAEALKSAGYNSYCSGKWHLSEGEDFEPGDVGIDKQDWPLQRGFDRYYGIINGATSFWNPKTLVRGNEIVTKDTDEGYKPEKPYYLTTAITDHACRYIDEHEGDNPYFLYVAYTAAHWPMHAPAEDIAKYKGVYDEGYDAIRKARYKRMQKMGVIADNVELSPTVGDWASVEDKAYEAKLMECYAAMIDNMDRGIGEILDVVEKRGEMDNTIILFLQDNGACAEDLSGPYAQKYMGDVKQVEFDGSINTFVSYEKNWANVSNTPFRLYKKNSHEGGIATPLIVHWGDGLKARNKIVDEPSHLIDIMATCIDVSGATYPTTYDGGEIRPMEGRSLIPICEGEAVSERPLFFAHGGKNGVRCGDWKIACEQNKPWELYHISEDRAELNNLASKYPERVEELKKMWNEWAVRAHVK
ncbi:MAG: arylsulfatase [Rikenellaceae bacterium]